MFKRICLYLSIFFVFSASALANSPSKADILVLQVHSGDIEIKLNPVIAPKSVERVKMLAQDGSYDGIVFHRVIDGFMAQTGDVAYGHIYGYNENLVGTGGSTYPNLPDEFSSLPFKRGVVAMARSSEPNSANSQFFICFADSPWLNNNYTIIGEVVRGMEHVDKLRKGNSANNGAVIDPDHIIKAYLK